MSEGSKSEQNLKNIFLHLLEKYQGAEKAELFWEEIRKNYSDRKRHYHTLDHLAHLLAQLNEVRSSIPEFDVTLFTLFYHDVVYNAKRSDNEEKSAELAVKRMSELNIPAVLTAQCSRQILATKTHVPSGDPATDLFTDADLSILGSSWEEYTGYYKKIRKEYSIYPDFMYNPGRKKVLAHFLSMEHIFKTEHFRSLYETQARKNLEKEMELL